MEAWLMQTQSLCIVALMMVGVVLAVKHRRDLHVKVMIAAMIWDILLILQIELSRSAILKASKAMTNGVALNIHVTLAVTTVILYGFMVYSGRAYLAGKIHLLRRHKTLGYITLGMRVLTFITSFWAVASKVE